MAWFEWLINLPDELEVIWRRRRSIATWIYACARYSSMAAVIPLFISFASHNVGVVPFYAALGTEPSAFTNRGMKSAFARTPIA